MPAFEKPVSTESRPALTALERDFRRLLRRASIELVVALGLPLLILLASVSSLVYFTHRVNHSDQVIARMNHAEAIMETMESNVRGYRLTMQKDYLTNCIEPRAELDPTLAGIRTLVSDNSSQERLLAQFQSQADDWIKYIDESLNRLTSKTKSDVNAPSQIQTSQNLINAVMESAEKFMDNERTLRDERYGWFGKSLVLTGAIFLLLACTVIPVVLHRHRTALKQVGVMYDASLEALQKAQQSALDANRAKDVFLAALSHELRNPLNPALLVASAEAENPELPEPVRSSFRVILDNIEMESRLIDDLLDLTRVSTGKLSLRRHLVDIHKIFMDALAGVQPDQLSKKITLTVEWNAQKNDVNGDPLRLRQIFWNILKNAIKFTPQDGTVRVNASNADSHVVIRVTDTGIGIKQEELSRIFNPFEQGEHAGKTGSQAYGGLGLGLAIAKNLTDMHAGAIHAESEGANKGSTFTVELPLAA